jgi:hypothetical protein
MEMEYLGTYPPSPILKHTGYVPNGILFPI